MSRTSCSAYPDFLFRCYSDPKCVKGRKRHLVVDTMGLVLAVLVHPANVQDRDGAYATLAKLVGQCPRLRHLWADAGYAGQLPELVDKT